MIKTSTHEQKNTVFRHKQHVRNEYGTRSHTI
jgi:hypothetical protein